MSEAHITLELSAAYHFEIKDLWPDGDAPDEVTAEVVADLIRQCGGLLRVIRDWDLDLPHLIDADIMVRARNPHWHQDTALFTGSAPQQWVSTRAKVLAL